MFKSVIILAFAFIASQFANGSVIPNEGVIPGLSQEQMQQFGGICITTLGLMVKKTANEHKHLETLNKSEGDKKQSIAAQNFEKIGGRYFYIEKENKLNWFAAVKACKTLGGQLAVIENQEEMNAIYEKQSVGKYWLDLNDLVKEGEFESWTTGLKASFLNWRSDQPDNFGQKESCVTMFGPLMYDDNCETENYFVCQA
ncbi:accessory gland protein Acp29AB-like [Drosophila elegans]|uniref:accessory gland protein Acp29AB-like n=1 Tax=Drosophila elegans TaxID=30023 RepID=UPI0007E7B85E|nr:accessory gland protein Acp29AB-like [Drosophila elegans]